jgi:hypothetical protein
MIAFRNLILLGLVSLVAAAPMLEERGSIKEGSMGSSYFGQQTGWWVKGTVKKHAIWFEKGWRSTHVSPNISDDVKAHLKTKSYVGVYKANARGRCGQWVAIKHGDKTIRAKVIDSTAVSIARGTALCWPKLMTAFFLSLLQQDKKNIIAGLRVFERLDLDEHQRYDIKWAFCNSMHKKDCPKDL